MKLQYQNSIQTILIHAELLMYGDVFTKIEQQNDCVVIACTAIVEGGGIGAQTSEIFEETSIEQITTTICSVDFSSPSDESSILWEVQLGDKDGSLVCESGYDAWDIQSLEAIVSSIKSVISSNEVIYPLVDLISM